VHTHCLAIVNNTLRDSGRIRGPRETEEIFCRGILSGFGGRAYAAVLRGVVVRDFPLVVGEGGTVRVDERPVEVCVTWVTRRRWAEAWLSAVAVGVRIRYEVGWAVDWVVDGYGIGIGRGRRQLKGGEIDRL
jgi:hypothetical protein